MITTVPDAMSKKTFDQNNAMIYSVYSKSAVNSLKKNLIKFDNFSTKLLSVKI
jgi:hypothetical protein